MELVTRCPGEITRPFDQSRAEKSVQKGTALWDMAVCTGWTVWICADIFAERRAPALNDGAGAALQALINQNADLPGDGLQDSRAIYALQQ
jgi:hypothetical protein